MRTLICENQNTQFVMKFVIEHNKAIQTKTLSYISEECSFDMQPCVGIYDLELAINKLTLSVVDNIVVQVSGFSGFKEWIMQTFQVPDYRQGNLRIVHNLSPGFIYGVNDRDLPVYVNSRTGWVCLGDPEGSGNAVEFIKDCVAVISSEGKFLALWLKPQRLPQL